MSFKIEEQCFFINDNISIMIDSLINNKVMRDHILFSQFNLTNVRRSVERAGLMVSVLDSGLSDLGTSSGWWRRSHTHGWRLSLALAGGHCFVL